MKPNPFDPPQPPLGFAAFRRRLIAAALSSPARNALGTLMVANDKDAGRFPYSIGRDEPTPVLQSD